MSYRYRTAASLIFSAAFIFSAYNAHGQALANNDPDHRLKPRASPKETPATALNKLPFEQSVIIYYGASNKPSPAVSKSQPTAASPGINSTNSASQQPKLTPSAALQAKQASSRSNLVLDLRPVVITYRITVPTLITNTESSTATKTNPALTSAKMGFAENTPAKNATASIAPKHEANLPAAATQAQNEQIAAAPPPFNDDSPSVSDSIAAVVANPKIEIGKNRSPVAASVTVPVPESAPPAVHLEAAIQVKEPNDPTRVAEKIPENTAVKKETFAADPIAANKAPTTLKDLGNIGTAASTASASSVEVVPEPVPNKEAWPPSQEIRMPAANAAAEPAPGIAIGPNGLVEMNNTAVRLTLESNYPEAEALLEKAIKENPTVAKFHRNLSIVFEKLNRFDDALASARTAANLDPSNPAILDQLCLLELAKGTPQAAVACYAKLDSVQPYDADSQGYYGMALFRAGRMDESLVILEKAAKSIPPVATVLNALGVVYFTKKRYDEAVDSFKNAVETNPDLSELRFNLAIAELACKNKPAALSQYNILKKDNSKLADQLYQAMFSDKVINVSDLKTGKR